MNTLLLNLDRTFFPRPPSNFIRYLFVIIAFVLITSIFVGCATTPTAPVKPAKKIILAWGSEKQDWTDHLMKELPVLGRDLLASKPNDYAEWCGKLQPIECYAQLISIMAKYESNFKPETSYDESSTKPSLKGVISRGLLQISFDSSRSYDCGTTNAQQLHDSYFNLECGIRILNRWIPNDGVIAGSAKVKLKKTGKIEDQWHGMGRYWSVGRSISKSYPKIKAYMKGLQK